MMRKRSIFVVINYAKTLQTMTPVYITNSDGSITLSVNFKPTGSMLEREEQISEAVNAVGLLASSKSLECFDTDGSAMLICNKVYRSRQEKKSIKHPMGRC